MNDRRYSRETPTMLASSYVSTPANMVGIDSHSSIRHSPSQVQQWIDGAQDALTRHQQESAPMPVIAPPTTRRLVQVFIADPDDNVPLADGLLYRGEQIFTDLTDQELFFEIDIKSALDAHNAKRVTIVDPSVKDRTEYLKPVRVRDLKMTVVTIASF